MKAGRDSAGGGRLVIALVVCAVLAGLAVVEMPHIARGVQRGTFLSGVTGTWASGDWLDWRHAVALHIDGDGSLDIGNGQGLSATGHVVHQSGTRYLMTLDRVTGGYPRSRSIGLVDESTWWGDPGRLRVDTRDPGICSGRSCTLERSARQSAA